MVTWLNATRLKVIWLNTIGHLAEFFQAKCLGYWSLGLKSFDLKPLSRKHVADFVEIIFLT